MCYNMRQATVNLMPCCIKHRHQGPFGTKVPRLHMCRSISLSKQCSSSEPSLINSVVRKSIQHILLQCTFSLPPKTSGGRERWHGERMGQGKVSSSDELLPKASSKSLKTILRSESLLLPLCLIFALEK